MAEEVCYWLFCFVKPGSSVDPKIFGFAEFIGAAALLVVFYMIADFRYKFRLAITPGALLPITFSLITFIGVATLLTELWLAEDWWLPKTVGLTRSIWQAMFGTLFLGAFLTWMYYAFIHPPVFCKQNAKRFTQKLYWVILKGNDAELAVIADELRRSAMSIVKHSRRAESRFENEDTAAEMENKKRKAGVEDYAYDLLLLIGNKKLCRHIAESSPVTALAFFNSMTAETKYDIPIGQFAKNISAEAIAYKDSILYQEGDGFTSGLIGYHKPWSQSIYGNFELIEALSGQFGSPLDVDYRAIGSWDGEQWEAYYRATLVALEGYLTSGGWKRHSYTIYRALYKIENAHIDLYKLDETTDYQHKDIYDRLRATVNFLNNAVDLIDEQDNPPSTKLRQREAHPLNDIYQLLANLMFDLLFAASTVSKPPETCWSIHHNATWSQFFGITNIGKTWKIIQFKLRRLLYDEVAQMTKMPNYKGARILGLLLNVMGFKVTTGREGYGRDYRPLAKLVHAWTRRNYLKLREELPDVAEAVLIGRITFDKEKCRLVNTFFKGLSKEAPREYLDLDPPPT